MRHSFVAGIPVLLVGFAVAMVAYTYPIGTFGRMGPGFLPLACGLLMVALGAAIAVFDNAPLDRISTARVVRPAAAVFAGLIAWTLSVERFGLVLATFLLVLLVSQGQRGSSLLTTVITATLLSAIGVGVFILGLNIRLTAFGG